MPTIEAMKNLIATNSQRSRGMSLAAAGAGMTVALTGLTVMLGWQFDVLRVTQPLPFTESMRFNTALLFFISGVGLVALALARARVATVAAVFTALVGFATVAQYLFDVNFGIDDLFFQHPNVPASPYPDRMAPNSALGFLLAGIALALAAQSGKFRSREMATALLSSLLLGLSSVALFGYLVGAETAYGWGKVTSMAIHTAAAFILYSAGLLTFLYAQASRSGNFSPRPWTAPVVGVLGITIATAAWQALDAREILQIQRANQLEFTAFQSYFESALRTDHDSLRRMGARMASSRPHDPAAWRADARQYVNDFPGYTAMAWLDRGGKIIGSAVRTHLASENILPTAAHLALSRSTKRFTIGPTLPLSDGTKGYIEVLPLYRASEFHGYLVVQKSYVGILDPMLAKIPLRDYDLQLFDRETLVYSRTEGSPVGDARWRAENTISVAARDWHLQVIPTEEYIQHQRSVIPPIILSGGIVIALLFATVVRLWQTKRGHTQQLAASEARLRSIADNMLEALIIIDIDSVIQSVNPAAEHIFGFRREELLGRRLDMLLPDAIRQDSEAFLRTAHHKSIDTTSEWEARRKDGTVFPFSMSLYEIAAPPGARHFACVCTDISQRRRTENLIRKLSLTDELTGLYNRRGFLTLAEQQLKLARRSQYALQIGFVDIDGMKAINDRFGHSAGDMAIRDVADILKATFRDSDVLARIGGDEFVVLTVATSAPEMDRLLGKLLEAITQINLESGRPYHLSVSTGSVSWNSQSDVSLESLLQQADQRMYHNKGRKRRAPMMTPSGSLKS